MVAIQVAAPVIQPVDGPSENLSLNNFFQTLLVAWSGITPPSMVRPSFQGEPPTIPDFNSVWMAFRYTQRPADGWPWIGQISDTQAQMQRHEIINVLCSFYGQDTDGQADAVATLTKDNMSLAQNLEALAVNNMGLAELGDLQFLPVVVKSRWRYRIDFAFGIRREIIRTWNTPSNASMQLDAYADSLRVGSVGGSVDAPVRADTIRVRADSTVITADGV